MSCETPGRWFSNWESASGFGWRNGLVLVGMEMEGTVVDEQEERQILLSCKCLMRSARSLVLDLEITCIWKEGRIWCGWELRLLLIVLCVSFGQNTEV